MKRKEKFWLTGAVVGIAILLAVSLWIRRDVRLQVLTLEMHQAVAGGHFDTIGKYIDQGVDIDRDNGGWTALLFAVNAGNFEMVKFLLDQYGADPNLGDHDSVTPIALAASRNDMDMIDLLVEHGASAEAAEGTWAAHMLEIKARSQELVGAASQGDIDLVKELLVLGVDLNTANESGNTAIHLAALAGDIELTRFLINQGARMDIQNAEGQTVLKLAVDHGQAGVARILLRAGGRL